LSFEEGNESKHKQKTKKIISGQFYELCEYTGCSKTSAKNGTQQFPISTLTRNCNQTFFLMRLYGLKRLKRAFRKPDKRKKIDFFMEHVNYVHMPILK
jgi:hypothetical protein